MSNMRINSDQKKPVYETFSLYYFLLDWVFRFFSLTIIISAIINFNSNHAATIFAISFFSMVFLFTGQPSIIVYNDRFEFRQGTFLNLFDKHSLYYYKDIETISIDAHGSPALDLLSEVLTDRLGPWNNINIELKNGELKSIGTRIYKKSLRKALMFIIKEYNQYSISNKH